jgi:hypothetical protein
LTDTIRIKRRAAGGAAGAPSSLAASELAYNEQDDTLWYGKGNSAGNATSIVSVGGPGAFAPIARGLPAGGTTGQVLSKNTATNYDTGWTTPSAAGGVLYNYLGGLTLSYVNTTTFGIATGAATSDDNTTLMTLTLAYTKTRAAWAVGSGNGALDTGTIAANTWYHIYLIERTDTGVVDVLMSLSASAPTMPASYNVKRRIGSIRTIAASNLMQFTQVGDQFIINPPVFDGGSAAGGISIPITTTLITLSYVPSGIQTVAFFEAFLTADPSGSVQLEIWSPDSAFLSGSFNLWGYASGGTGAADFNVRTNTSRQIAIRAYVAVAGSASYGVWFVTKGWTDNRGK